MLLTHITNYELQLLSQDDEAQEMKFTVTGTGGTGGVSLVGLC